MSTAWEYLNAQKQLWDKFCDGTLPRKHWPKHFLAPAALEHIMLHGVPEWEKKWLEDRDEMIDPKDTPLLKIVDKKKLWKKHD